MAVTSLSEVPMVETPDLFPTAGKKDLKREDFMLLFITQLQYQDPLKPMDSYEMASQLAQFSTMDATMQMSENMEELLAYQTSQNNLQLLTLIGHGVQAFGNMLAVSEGEAGATEFSLSNTTETCVVEIYDSADRLVRTIDMGGLPAGVYDLAWDGNDTLGNAAPDGAYYYAVKAKDSIGLDVDVDYRTTGNVTGLEYNSGQAVITIDNQINVSVSEVVRVL